MPQAAKKRRKARLAGPKPASGPLEIVQAFLNTKDLKHKTDELSNPWELARWLASRKLLPETTPLTKGKPAKVSPTLKLAPSWLKFR